MSTKIQTTKPSNTPNEKKPKKKLRLKLPSALTILIAVLFLAVFITWIVHFVTTGNAVSNDNNGLIPVLTTKLDDSGYAIKGEYIFTGYWSGGNTWYITEGANAIIDGEWVTIEGWSGVESDILINGSITIDKPIDSIISGSWFNFEGSNWYVSGDGMYGVGDIIRATVAGIFSASGLIFFMLGIGIMIELLMETEVLKGLVNSIIKGMSNKRILLAPVLFIVFALWGTIMGTQEATLALMPIIVPALIIAGFDAMTGFLIILVGCTTGIAASVLEPFALGTLASEFNDLWGSKGFEGTIGIGTGIGLRLVNFIVFSALGCGFITWYANRVLLKNKSAEPANMIVDNKIWAKEAFGEEEHTSLNKKQKIALGIAGATILWMIFVLLPWSSWVEGINDMNWWNTVSHMFFFSSLFGAWSFFQLGWLFIFGWFVCAKMFRYTKEQMWNNCKNTWKSFAIVAYILTLSRATSIVLTNSGTASFLATTVFGSLGQMHPGNLALTVFPLYVGMAIFIPSMTGLAGITAPIIRVIIQEYDQEQMRIAMIGIMALYPLAQGVVNMVSPTTGLVIAQAEASHTSYAKAIPLLAGFAATIIVAGLIVTSLDMFLLMG